MNKSFRIFYNIFQIQNVKDCIVVKSWDHSHFPFVMYPVQVKGGLCGLMWPQRPNLQHIRPQIRAEMINWLVWLKDGTFLPSDHTSHWRCALWSALVKALVLYLTFSRSGPSTAPRAHMGSPVWAASNHFTATSPESSTCLLIIQNDRKRDKPKVPQQSTASKRTSALTAWFQKLWVYSSFVSA